MAPSAPVTLNEERLEMLAIALDAFSARVRQRGAEYADRGRVGRIAVEASGLRAEVRGTTTYEVTWRFDGGAGTPSCTCPVGPWCKHAYALADVILQTEESGRSHYFDDLPARAPAPPPWSSDAAALERLRRSSSAWGREHAVGTLLEGTGVSPWTLPGGVPSIAMDPDPDVRCWRLARALHAAAPRAMRPVLQPFLERPDLAERVATRERAGLVAALSTWASAIKPRADRSLRLEVQLRDRAHGGTTLFPLARLTSPRLDDAPRTLQQLQQLRTDLRRNPAGLPPEAAALLTALIEHNTGGADLEHYQHYGEGYGSSVHRLLRRVAGSPLVTWGATSSPATAQRAGIEPGTPVRFADAAVRIEPTCVARDGEPWIDLVVLWPDGRSRRLDEVVVLRQGYDGGSGLVLSGGVLHALVAEPPAELVTRFEITGGFVVAPAERAAVFGVLAPAFAGVAAAIETHTFRRPSTPIVTLDLRDDEWLQIRLLAAPPDGSWRPGEPLGRDTVVYEWSPEGRWLALAGDAGATADEIERPALDERPAVVTPADVWLDVPAPADTDPARAWLDGLRTSAGPSGQTPTAADRHVGWWLQTSRRKMDALADAWDRRPAGVVFLGNPRARRLFGAAGRVAPRVRIESSGTDWFALSAEWEAEGQALSPADVAMLRSTTARFVRLPSGGWVQREAAAANDEAARLLADLGIEAGEPSTRVTLWQLAGAAAGSLDAIEALGGDPETVAALRTLRAKVARFRGIPVVRKPAGLRVTLRPYQRRGLDFLAHCASLGLGAILADDMGLGKTVQTLAWLAHLVGAEPDGGPSLVVCPASVMHNWAREAARFAPKLRVLVLERGAGRHALRAELADYDLVVTNYALLRRDLDAWRTVALRALVLDEAQNVKNPDAAVTRAAAALGARHRLALTGTPLENRALDLWSIMEVVNPGYLGARRAFVERFDRADTPPHRRTLLAARLRPVLLRRLKSAVAPELPERIEERRDCELTSGQRRLYLAEAQRSRALLAELGDSPEALRKGRIHVLAALTRLRQICCHPSLGGGKAGLGSGKFEALVELLEPLLAEGHKVLVFSQFVGCLKLLAAELGEHGMPHHMLTGETLRRDAVVAAFEQDERACVFLLSLKAAGTGLNLTAASYVVLFDPWWNPAVEAQAIDRTHRIGQDKTVIAYRLVARGTIEEKIFELQQRKAALVRDVLGEDGFGRALTREDLAFLFESDG